MKSKNESAESSSPEISTPQTFERPRSERKGHTKKQDSKFTGKKSKKKDPELSPEEKAAREDAERERQAKAKSNRLFEKIMKDLLTGIDFPVSKIGLASQNLFKYLTAAIILIALVFALDFVLELKGTWYAPLLALAIALLAARINDKT